MEGSSVILRGLVHIEGSTGILRGLLAHGGIKCHIEGSSVY